MNDTRKPSRATSMSTMVTAHNHKEKFHLWTSGQVRRVTRPIRREIGRRRRAGYSPRTRQAARGPQPQGLRAGSARATCHREILRVLQSRVDQGRRGAVGSDVIETAKARCSMYAQGPTPQPPFPTPPPPRPDPPSPPVPDPPRPNFGRYQAQPARTEAQWLGRIWCQRALLKIATSSSFTMSQASAPRCGSRLSASLAISAMLMVH